MVDYLNHWGLSERPFEASSGAGHFFSGRQHREALERLLYLVRDGDMSFGVLTGEIGCGKTVVANMVARQLLGRECHVVMLENSFGNFDEIMREIAAGMNPVPALRRHTARRDAGYSRYELVRRFRDQLEFKFTRLRRRLVVMLDEAQQLSEEALVELKNLTNLAGGGTNPLTIILSGQPELGELIRSLPQIDQRIGLRYHLLPLEAEEVGDYVDSRMRAAGYKHETSVFADEAKAALAQTTGGVPREINRICKLALDRAFSLGRERVEADMVGQIAEDVFKQSAWL
jgi:general secretion pathway protein A